MCGLPSVICSTRDVPRSHCGWPPACGGIGKSGGNLVEGRRWLDRALALPGGSPLLRARALKAAGNLARDQGDYAAAERQHDEALGLFDRAGTSADVAACLNNLGNVALDQAGGAQRPSGTNTG